jgi:argininosuccinate lyase
MKKLWMKKGTKNNMIVDQYCFSDGIKQDNALVLYDVYGSLAHAAMLEEMGIINKDESEKLKKALIEIINLYKKGDFVVKDGDEDIHTKVENHLANKLGDLGKKIHTARSRNDQVLVDLRMYAKKEMQEIAIALASTATAFISFAEKYQFCPMPGYTHMQKAMPSSVGLWGASFAEQLDDLLNLSEAVYNLNDQSPLGSGAAYGVSLKVDRQFTASKLGFKKVQKNSLYSQISRPTFQLAILQLMTQIMLTASRFAGDMLLFTTAEFGFFDVDPSICTGSSIMPQKKNLDVMEYVRAKTSTVITNELKTATIAAGLPSGYNADFGETKGAFMESLIIVKQTLEVLSITVKSVAPNEVKLKEACTAELYATHHAYMKVLEGVPFRTAYLDIKETFKNLVVPDTIAFLKKSSHIGGTGNLKLNETKKTLMKKNIFWEKEIHKLNGVISSLLS